MGRRGILEPEKVCPVQRGEVLALSVQWSMTEVHWSQMAWFSQQGLVPSPQRPRAQQMSDGRMSVVSRASVIPLQVGIPRLSTLFPVDIDLAMEQVPAAQSYACTWPQACAHASGLGPEEFKDLLMG